MAGKHLLQGLIKWSSREPWSDRFEEILEEHLQPACAESGLEIDDIVSTLGEDLFMSTAWACAFEDFLTREFNGGANVVDEYLKRRGWKESASVRAYMAALRNSTMSLYEVSDIVRDKSFRARDLVRGGEPVLVSEKYATRSLKPWDRIAARVVRVGSQTQICGGVLPYDRETSETLVEALRRFDTLSDTDMRKLAAAIGQNFDDAASVELRAPTEKLRMISSMITAFWLLDAIDRAKAPLNPSLHNAEGDDLLLCEVRFPLTSGTTGDDIRAVLDARPEFRPADTTSWNWIGPQRAKSELKESKRMLESLTFETRLDDGALSLGHVMIEDTALVLSVNSQERSNLGRSLLSEILGQLLGRPSVKTESVEQVRASHGLALPNQLDIPEAEQSAIIHEYLDRHYRTVLDEPVAMLGGESPRAAVRTESGRIKVVDWLKLMENTTAKFADADSAMATYDFGWLWTELGVSELRR